MALGREVCRLPRDGQEERPLCKGGGWGMTSRRLAQGLGDFGLKGSCILLCFCKGFKMPLEKCAFLPPPQRCTHSTLLLKACDGLVSAEIFCPLRPQCQQRPTEKYVYLLSKKCKRHKHCFNPRQKPESLIQADTRWQGEN